MCVYLSMCVYKVWGGVVCMCGVCVCVCVVCVCVVCVCVYMVCGRCVVCVFGSGVRSPISPRGPGD
jgi:hypothetical protein